MVAPHERSLSIVRGGKSELRRAGWSVIRTALWNKGQRVCRFGTYSIG